MTQARTEMLEGKEKDLKIYSLPVTERKRRNREPIQPRVLTD